MAQQGFQYEINACNVLKDLGFVPENFRPAGAGHDQPDLMLKYKGKTAGCELKITAASAGSLVLKYDTPSKQWGFGKIKPDEKEKLFLTEIADSIQLFDKIHKRWKEIPFRREKDELWEATAGKISSQQRYERDRDTFPDVIGEIPATYIENYYAQKDTDYVNVGTHGFYLMGSRNPFKLKNVPRFGQSAKAIYRARVQYKGSGNYQFTFEMQFTMKTKSKYNIAPCAKNNVAILKDKLDLSCFL